MYLSLLFILNVLLKLSLFLICDIGYNIYIDDDYKTELFIVLLLVLLISFILFY